MPLLSPRKTRIANLVAGAILVALALALWFDPGLVIRAEFAKQRLLLGASVYETRVEDHDWTWVELPADTPDAPTLVLVHGYTGSKENWYRLARALKGRYRIVMPDLPGWGASERNPRTDYGFVAQSARLAAFLANPEISDGTGVVLVGHSMGGGIAALTAARQPRLVARVALIDAAGVRFRDNAFGKAVLAGENPFAVYDEVSLRRYLDTVFHDRAAIPYLPWPVDRIYIAQRRRDADFEQSVLAKIGRGDERFLPGTEAANIGQPALLLWCRRDKVIDPSAMALYAERIPHASQVLLEDCGHMSLMERPAETAEALALLIEHGVPAGGAAMTAAPTAAIDVPSRSPMNAIRPLVLALCCALLAACGEDPEVAKAAAAAEAAAREAKAQEGANAFDDAVRRQNWALAKAQADVLMHDYPGTAAAKRVAGEYDAVVASHEAGREAQRTALLWSYSTIGVPGGLQRAASIYAKDEVDVDSSGPTKVRLIFRDHASWGRSSYLVLERGDFDCYGGCRLQIVVDGQPSKPLPGSRPNTHDAIAMFIEDEKALWRLAKSAKTIEIEFPVKGLGKRKALFEVAGLDPAQLPGW